MATEAVAGSAQQRTQNIAAKIAVGLLIATLLCRAVLFAAAGIAAIHYPWELDYGEGIVWQQMRWIFSAKAYGPIDQFPAIVFHYTPLYHAVTSVIAHVLGTDELATGRAVSLLCTVAAAVASAILVRMLLEGRATEAKRRICGCVAALLVFTLLPVLHWAPLMRVDMLAVALSLFGLVAAFAAIERPGLIYVASLLFLAAIYTKQTSVAAPVAAFGVLLAVRPKLARQGMVASIASGLTALVVLGWLTDGGFYRHIFLYNVNRPDLGRLSSVFYAASMQVIYVTLACFVAVRRVLDLRSRCHTVGQLRAAGAGDARLLIAIAYLGITTLMLILVAKSGSNINYFLEWFFALAIFAAMAIHEGTRVRSVELRKMFAVGIPLGLALQAIMAGNPPFDTDPLGPRAQQLALLSREVKAARKPVISDDMVLLLRSGRDVLWEPAIFAELASTGDWDERPFVRRIRDGEFAFFVTWGQRGHHRFDERYNPAVADALDAEYPVKEELAGLTIHKPRLQQQPVAAFNSDTASGR